MPASAKASAGMGSISLAAARAAIARVRIALLFLPSGHHIRPQAVDQNESARHLAAAFSTGSISRLSRTMVFSRVCISSVSSLLQTTQGEGPQAEWTALPSLV